MPGCKRMENLAGPTRNTKTKKLMPVKQTKLRPDPFFDPFFKPPYQGPPWPPTPPSPSGPPAPNPVDPGPPKIPWYQYPIGVGVGVLDGIGALSGLMTMPGQGVTSGGGSAIY